MSGGNWKEMLSASEKGNLQLLQYHIKMGANPNYQHPEFFTAPLLESVRHEHYSISQFLLENGAKPDIVEDLEGVTPIEIALSNRDFRTIHLLNQYLPESKKMAFKNVLITGGNRGIGKAIAQKLLSEGHRVVITVRNKEQGQQVVQELAKIVKNDKISMLVGDLSTIESTYQLAKTIISEFPEIDTFISNAGIWASEKQINSNGLEMSFMVNYLAHYILCQELLPILQKNKAARIIDVNAGLYTKGKLNIEKTPTGLDFHSIRTYANSKLCGILFNLEFAKQIEGSGVTINAVHPGIIQTELGDSPKLMSKIVNVFKRFWKQPNYGAIAPAWLATSSELGGINGFFFNQKKLMQYNRIAQNKELRRDLMNFTKKILDSRN